MEIRGTVWTESRGTFPWLGICSASNLVPLESNPGQTGEAPIVRSKLTDGTDLQRPRKSSNGDGVYDILHVCEISLYPLNFYFVLSTFDRIVMIW